MCRAMLATLAIVAVCSTAGATACLALLSSNLSLLPSVRATAIASAALQGALLIVLSWFASSHAQAKIRELSRPYIGVAFGLGVLASLISLVAAALTLAWMEPPGSNEEQIRSGQSSKVISVSIMLAVACTSQIAFMAIHFAQSRHQRFGSHPGPSTSEASSPWSPAAYVKSIRYSQTMPRTSDSEESSSTGLKDTPPSLRSKLIHASPLPLAFPPAIRHISSRTRLLQGKQSIQSLTLSTNIYPNATQESFDTWDTSSVDAHNRQVVMEVSTSPTTHTYALETIPASPRASMNAGSILNIAPPPRRIPTRSRSHSPATMRGALRGRVTATPSELHIHPLFRSDSPTTPPILTPGTRVDAAPDAGQILAQHVPKRPLPRVRSGSLPSLSRRPFARQVDDENAGKGSSEGSDSPDQERKMTPPVPDWVLNSKVPPIPRKSASRQSLQARTC